MTNEELFDVFQEAMRELEHSIRQIDNEADRYIINKAIELIDSVAWKYEEDEWMFEIMSERDALLEQKHQNDDWWSELDFWLNKRKTESKQIDIDRVLNFIEDLKR